MSDTDNNKIKMSNSTEKINDPTKNQKNEENTIKNDKSQTFKLLAGTKFCSYKRVNNFPVQTYPLILEQDVTFNSCVGLKVTFMGQPFYVTERSKDNYKFNFPKGTIYTLESDQIGLIQSLNHSQEFKVQNATKIEVPVGTVLISENNEQDISITINHRMILDIIS